MYILTWFNVLPPSVAFKGEKRKIPYNVSRSGSPVYCPGWVLHVLRCYVALPPSRTLCPRFWALVCSLKSTRRGRILQECHFSLHGSILPTRPMWQFWASETLQKWSSNASVTLQKRLTSGLHLLLGRFIHHGRFHGQQSRCSGVLH